jgi:hypothetical protein
VVIGAPFAVLPIAMKLRIKSGASAMESSRQLNRNVGE